MDTSPEYILQCEKAEEIQQFFRSPLPPGTFWARKAKGYYSEGVTGYDYKRLSEWVILPRQDQLQDIVFGEDLMRGDVGYPLFRISRFESKGGYNAFSMEQLWLAFVMSEHYHKKWSGTDWIGEKVEP